MIDVELPPTEWCLRMLPVFKGLLILQGLLAILRFVVLDIVGGLMMAIACLMGYQCVKGSSGLSVTSCLYYTVIAITCAVLDTILALMVGGALHAASKGGLFPKEADTLVHVVQVAMLLSPLCMFLSGWLAWSFYKDCRDQLESAPLLPRAAPAPPRQNRALGSTPLPSKNRSVQEVRAEFEKMEGQLSDERKKYLGSPEFSKKCDNVFDKTDTDKNGTLSMQELKENFILAVKDKEGLRLDPIFVKAFDENKNEKIEKDEFREMMKYFEMKYSN